MARTTPRSLNHALRLGRLTVPQWAAVAMGALSLWVCTGFTAHITDPNAHLIAVVAPTILMVTPIMTLWRGGVERYPAQLSRYAGRRVVVYTLMVVRAALIMARKGGIHAQVRLQAARRRQG